MSAPTVEERVEDIRRRARLLEHFFDLQYHLETSDTGGWVVEPDVYLALKDYAEGIAIATLAIDTAEDGMANPKAPDVLDNRRRKKGCA